MDQIKSTSPDARKSLVQVWKDSARKVAADQSETTTTWALEQHMDNASKIAKLAFDMDGLGATYMDPTRTTPEGLSTE